MNIKTKIGSIFLLAAIMVVGTISMTIPQSFAEPGANIQEIKCVNSNININGIDIKKSPRTWAADAATSEALPEDGLTEANGNGFFGNGGLNIDKNLVNICVNFNYNEQEDEVCESTSCPD